MAIRTIQAMRNVSMVRAPGGGFQPRSWTRLGRWRRKRRDAGQHRRFHKRSTLVSRGLARS